jgi:hypothetical protein
LKTVTQLAIEIERLTDFDTYYEPSETERESPARSKAFFDFRKVNFAVWVLL